MMAAITKRDAEALAKDLRRLGERVTAKELTKWDQIKIDGAWAWVMMKDTEASDVGPVPRWKTFARSLGLEEFIARFKNGSDAVEAELDCNEP